MDILQIFILAIIQGLTEFLPISSSAHLILVPVLTGWQDQGLSFDIAVHVGTLTAVIIYFRQELKLMAYEWSGSLFGKPKTQNSKLAWAVIFGTVPLVIAGFLFKDIVSEHFRSPIVIALATIVFGLLLWYADFSGKHKRDEYSLKWKDILIIGIFQVIALIPGTSRSGITITAGLLRGLTPTAAARFSFLLSIPTILASSCLLVVQVFNDSDEINSSAILLGAVLAGGSAYICIHYFLKLLNKISMLPFVVYRLILGALLLFIFL